MFNLSEIYRERAEEIWSDLIDGDGISMKYSLEQFYNEMQDNRVREKYMYILNDELLSCSKVLVIFSFGMANYFMINDMRYGKVCNKCGSWGYIALILDGNYKENLEKKLFVPSFENYFASGVFPDSYALQRMFPVPINPQTDYWYCPCCNEMHRFKYDKETGLGFDQEVIKVNIDRNLKMPEDGRIDKPIWI